MYPVILTAHIIAGILTGGAGAYALVMLWNKTDSRYRQSALVLGVFATFEILSGTLLAVLSVDISAAAVCERIALYLALVLAIETLLYIRMKDIAIVAPVMQVLTPIGTSLAVLFAAAFAGL